MSEYAFGMRQMTGAHAGLTKVRPNLPEHKAFELFGTAISKAETVLITPCGPNRVRSATLTSKTATYEAWVEHSGSAAG